MKAKEQAEIDKAYLEKRQKELQEFIESRIKDEKGEYIMSEVKRRGMVKDKQGKYVMPEADADEGLDYHLFIDQQPNPQVTRPLKT